MRSDQSANEPTEVMPPIPRRQALPPQPADDTSDTDSGEKIDVRREDGSNIRFAIGKTRDFLQWVAIVVEILLLIRFIFKLIGASPSNVFAFFLYALTDLIRLPFNGLVYDPIFRANQYFEWTTLIAMAIYALVFWLLTRFVRLLVSEPEEATD